MEDEPKDGTDIDQQIRINELREEARELAGSDMTEWESDETPPEISEAFWSSVVAYEKAEQTTHFDLLKDKGVELPPPEELDDSQLGAKLWVVITELRKLNTYLSQTDHLSDRQLYELLWRDVLWESTPDLPLDAGWNCHIDMVSSGSDEDNEIYLAYYADDEERKQWATDFPEEPIPPRAALPFDRDRKLPVPPEPNG